MARPIGMQVRGLETTRAQIEELGAGVEREVQKGIDTTVRALFRRMRARLRSTKTGRIYARGAKTHRASAPGEAPAIDKRRLIRSVFKEIDRLSGKVGTLDPIGAWLEFGAKRSGAGGLLERRPWVRPSEREERPRFLRRIRRALRRAERGARNLGRGR